MKPVPAEVETSLHCSSEYHLARLKSEVAPLIYSLGLRLSKKSGIFYTSAETLARYPRVLLQKRSTGTCEIG